MPTRISPGLMIKGGMGIQSPSHHQLCIVAKEWRGPVFGATSRCKRWTVESNTGILPPEITIAIRLIAVPASTKRSPDTFRLRYSHITTKPIDKGKSPYATDVRKLSATTCPTMPINKSGVNRNRISTKDKSERRKISISKSGTTRQYGTSITHLN